MTANLELRDGTPAVTGECKSSHGSFDSITVPLPLQIKWISKEDDLPEKSLDVYVVGKFTKDFMSAPGNYNLRPGEVVSGWYFHSFQRIYTHWMPFPAIVKEGTISNATEKGNESKDDLKEHSD